MEKIKFNKKEIFSLGYQEIISYLEHVSFVIQENRFHKIIHEDGPYYMGLEIFTNKNLFPFILNRGCKEKKYSPYFVYPEELFLVGRWENWEKRSHYSNTILYYVDRIPENTQSGEIMMFTQTIYRGMDKDGDKTVRSTLDRNDVLQNESYYGGDLGPSPLGLSMGQIFQVKGIKEIEDLYFFDSEVEAEE